jgi:hypothetical protein
MHQRGRLGKKCQRFLEISRPRAEMRQTNRPCQKDRDAPIEKGHSLQKMRARNQSGQAMPSKSGLLAQERLSPSGTMKDRKVRFVNGFLDPHSFEICGGVVQKEVLCAISDRPLKR